MLGGAAKHWVSLAFCLNKHTHHTQASSGFECRLCRSEPTAPGQALGVWEGWLPDTLVCPEWGLAAGEPQGESCWKTHLKERKTEKSVQKQRNQIKHLQAESFIYIFFLGNIQKYTCGNSQLHSSRGCWGLKPGGRRRRETGFFWRACRGTKVCRQPADQHREPVYKPGDKLRPTHSDQSCFSALPHDIHALSVMWRLDSELRLQWCIFASVNQENRIARGSCFNVLRGALGHGANDLKRISNRAVQKTNRYLKGMTASAKEVCSVMLNILWSTFWNKRQQPQQQQKKKKTYSTSHW